MTPDAHSPQPAPAVVDAAETVFLWPVRIEANGELFSKRSDDKTGPSEWLKLYAEWIEKHGEEKGCKTWQRLNDPLDQSFGFPELRPREVGYAEFVYFHPFIERVLYEKNQDRRVMEVLFRNDLKHLNVRLNGAAEPISLDVLRIHMFLFFTDVAIVTVHVKIPPSKGKRDSIEISELIAALDQSRRVYAPYFYQPEKKRPEMVAALFPTNAQWDPPLRLSTLPQGADFQRDTEEVFQKRRPPIAPHWCDLIKPLKAWNECHDQKKRCKESPALYFAQLGDERAFTMAHVASAKVAEFPERFHYGLALQDGVENGWPYAEEFLRKGADVVFYDRFWQPDQNFTTRYAITNYSFLLLTDNSWLSHNVLNLHFRHHYLMLNLLALAQKSSMLIAWERLSDLLREYANTPPTKESREDFHNRHKALAEDLAAYIALFEFSEVSSQLQPKQLFEILRTQIGSKALSEELMRQVEFARNVELTNFQEQETKNQTKLQRIANAFIPAALALSLLGLSIGTTENAGLDGWLQGKFGFGLESINPAILLRELGLIALVIYLAYKIYGGYLRRMDKS